MASVQSRTAQLDKWTTREQLCLASAVASSGDQNWMLVSRTLKQLCGNSGPNRPPDWFSQKSCAVQYGHLLESVDSPKRKKRASEGGSGISSPSPAETPADLILQRLTVERVKELKVEIRRGQEEYAKEYNDLKLLESETVTDEQLAQMWSAFEKEEEIKHQEEINFKNQIRERDQRKQEMQRNWRVSGSAAAQPKSTDTATTVVDVEEIKVSDKNAPSTSAAINNVQQAQGGTSPLLSSLLKSPTTTGSSTTTTTTVTGSSASATAPTITTLLTSGSIPQANQLSITLKNLPSSKALHLLTRPISGLAGDCSSSSQTLLSPSQSAPTLSMLLEKNKTTPATTSSSDSSSAAVSKTSNIEKTQKAEIKSEPDSNNEQVPMDIDEDVTAVEIQRESSVSETDETDPNEEQQLLEVFKNIGNIDELDIDVAAVIDDEEVDFLKEVGMEPSNDSTDILNFENKTETTKNSNETTHSLFKKEEPHTVEPKSETEKKPVRELKVESVKTEELENKTDVDEALEIKTEIETAEKLLIDESVKTLPAKVEKESYDEILLKEKSLLDDTLTNSENEAVQERENETSEKNELSMEQDETKNVENELIVVESIENVAVEGVGDEKAITKENSSRRGSTASDVIVIPTDDDDSNESKNIKNREHEYQKEVGVSTEGCTNGIDDKMNLDSDKAECDDDPEKITDVTAKDIPPSPATAVVLDKQENENRSLQPEPPISIPDTDEELSDVSNPISNIKEEKIITTTKLTVQIQRKNLPDCNLRNDSKTDDDMSTISTSAPPVRPPTVRKLRDRDRSESPLIEDEAATASDHSTPHRSRRRYSSTPLSDNVPDSPASSICDDRETRASKKTLLSIYNALYHSKYALTVQLALAEDKKYNEICRRPMDFPTIRKNIESGSIRTIYELQRDFMLMCMNGIMLFNVKSTTYKAALGLLHECKNIREFMTPSQVQRSATSVAPKTEKEAKEPKEPREPREPKEPKEQKECKAPRSRASSRKSLRNT